MNYTPYRYEGSLYVVKIIYEMYWKEEIKEIKNFSWHHV